ncbi:uncharacterized protein DS421_15g512490 [Arachis hypogaea]|nr:uncharacterized protein DS421_15g512490 [Arachis hypogaea]
MATSSHHLSTIPPSSSKAATCDKPVVKNGKDFAPEPEASELKTWESQVLLPLTIDDSIPIGYFDSNNRLFRNPPKTNIGGYHAWLSRVETEKTTLWKEIRIYDLIQLSKITYTVNSGLMGGAFCNNRPISLGREILTTTQSTTGVKYSINLSSTTYQSFILNNRGRDGEPVSDNEHIAFLLYWLSGIVFCARNIQVEIAYVPLAVMLAEGKKLCLAKLFLARLYLTLDWITAHMREKKRITNADGPVWFFQLWLSAIFESELQPRSTQKSLTDSTIAGQRLLNLVFPDRLMPSHDKMKYFFRAFYYLPEKDHNINLTPFANCQTGPKWLTQFLTPAGVTQKESIIIWSQFLTPQLLFAGFPGENDLRTAVYMPNAVSRQFGLAQAIPSPYHFQESQPSHVKTISLEDLLRIQKDNAIRRNKFHLFPFKPCPLTTYSFFSWWKNYYSSIEVAFNTCCQRMTTVLVMQQKRNFNSSNRRNDTSNTSNDNLDGPVISQQNEKANENISSSDESVSKFSLEKDVNALSASDRLASQVTVTPTISLIAPNTENMMVATSNRPMPKTNANKLQASELPPSERSEKQIPITSIHAQTPNVVNDLLADLESLNEAYACSMDTQKAIVESCSTIQSHPSTEQPHTTLPTTKIVDNSILLPLSQQLSVILSKPILTLATDPQFKAQLSDILQTFSNTSHPETTDPLLAHLRMVYEDLYAKFPDSQAAISSCQQLTESLSKLKQDISSFEIVKATLAVHITKAKDRGHELSEEIRDLEQQLAVKRGAKSRLDAALTKNEAQFAKASGMLDSSNAALQLLEEKMLSAQEVTKEARNFQTVLQAEVIRLKEIFES